MRLTRIMLNHSNTNSSNSRKIRSWT